MTASIILLILGFLLLIKGADWLVDGSSALARKYNVSELAIGLTVVAFGTSMPELVVNSFAAYQSHPDIAFGNIIGSNIFNLFAILGITGLIAPLTVQSGTVWREIPLSLLAAVVLFLLANSIFSDTAVLSRPDAMILLLLFAFFLWYVFRQMKSEYLPDGKEHKVFTNLRIWLFIILGLACLVAGGRFVATSSVKIAEAMGVSQTVIGLTIVAIGTSLPELATSAVAAVKKSNDIAVGNIIGSNIFNIFFILGISALIRPLNYNPEFNKNLYLLGFGTILLFIAMFSGKKKRLDRWEAAILLAIYIGYTIYLINQEL